MREAEEEEVAEADVVSGGDSAAMYFPVVFVSMFDCLIPGTIFSVQLYPGEESENGYRFSRESGMNRVFLMYPPGGDVYGLVAEFRGVVGGRMNVKGLFRGQCLGELERNERGQCLITRCLPIRDDFLVLRTSITNDLMQIKSLIDSQFLLMGEFGKGRFISTLSDCTSITSIERNFLTGSDLSSIREQLDSSFTPTQFESISFILMFFVQIPIEMKKVLVQSKDTRKRIEAIKVFLSTNGSGLKIGIGKRPKTSILRLDSKISAILFFLVSVLLLLLKGIIETRKVSPTYNYR